MGPVAGETVGVLLAHWGLLHALPSATIPLQPQDAQPVAMTFTTRTIMPVAQDGAPGSPSRTVKTQLSQRSSREFALYPS